MTETSDTPLVRRLNEIIVALPTPIVTIPDGPFKASAWFKTHYRTVPVKPGSEFILQRFKASKSTGKMIAVLATADSSPFDHIEVRENHIRNFSVGLENKIVEAIGDAIGKKSASFGRAKTALLKAMETERVTTEKEKAVEEKVGYSLHPLWGAF